MAATWFSQEAFNRLFKEAELASSTEYTTCAANAESMDMTAKLPLENLRHEAFAQRMAAGASATASYAHAHGRERDNVAAVKGGQLVTGKSYAAGGQNTLAALPTIRKILEGVEARTMERINNAQISGAFGAADRFAEFVAQMNKAIEPTAHPGLKSYVRGR